MVTPLDRAKLFLLSQVVLFGSGAPSYAQGTYQAPFPANSYQVFKWNQARGGNNLVLPPNNNGIGSNDQFPFLLSAEAYRDGGWKSPFYAAWFLSDGNIVIQQANYTTYHDGSSNMVSTGVPVWCSKTDAPSLGAGNQAVSLMWDIYGNFYCRTPRGGYLNPFKPSEQVYRFENAFKPGSWTGTFDHNLTYLQMQDNVSPTNPHGLPIFHFVPRRDNPSKGGPYTVNFAQGPSPVFQAAAPVY